MKQNALANRITTIPPRLACWRSRLEKRPFVSAAALGACLGILNTLSSVLLLPILLRLLPPEQWGNSAASSLDGLGQGAVFALAVIWAPLIETLLGQLVPVEFARRFGAHPLVCVLLSALVFGGGHYVSGGLVHGISTFFGGLFLAWAYVASRRAGIGPGFLAAFSAHALHNMLLVFVVARLFPGAL